MTNSFYFVTLLQRMPLTNEKQGLWIMEKELPEGHYEYKYIVDGEWLCNKDEQSTYPNKDGHVNNYVDIIDDDATSINSALRKRLSDDDFDLTEDERLKVRQFLESRPDDE
ncbi:hypothetical protein Pint_05933 [Pistacia integerrima]|uniref:Uncharacterized protein n=1 Tax=Pistacia integerrima TaxID=434235 RepID=A0ACC0Z461_9ROSI|nr:hypothetical protein Pint_05933 [Pistacia integerrima]